MPHSEKYSKVVIFASFACGRASHGVDVKKDVFVTFSQKMQDTSYDMTGKE